MSRKKDLQAEIRKTQLQKKFQLERKVLDELLGFITGVPGYETVIIHKGN